MQRIAGLLVAFIVVSVFARAQGSTAQINGSVRDSSGLAVAGAEIKATQTATGVIRNATSDGEGGYVLPNLPIGPYVVEITKAGFSKYVQSGVVLQVNSNPTVDAALKVGSVSEQVTVEANAALVETRSTGVGTVVDNQRVLEMPLNGRQATELIFLAGMANIGQNVGPINSVRNYPTVVISVAGGIGNGISYSLDGANHNDPANNLNLPLPFPDALQEFKVETSALPAQYGYHSAAAVNAITKSGTNQFHGTLFEFLRNGDFNARNTFAITRDTLKRNQFGGVIGGPIKKDRLFFFAGWQDTIQKSTPPQTIAYVPTPAMLNGDFTQFASAACQGANRTLPAALGFVNNQIAPARLNPAAFKIAARIPTATDPCGKITFGLVTNPTENLGVTRLDWQKNDKQSIFGRFSVANQDSPTTFDGKNGLTLNTNAAHSRVYALALSETYLFSPTVISSLHFGATRTELPKYVDNFASWKDLGVNANSFQANNPRISVTGNGFAIGSGSAIVSLPYSGPNLSFAEDLSVVRGAHQYGFGGSFLRNTMNLNSGINATGLLTFNGSVTGLSLADFLVGNASAWAQGNANGFYNRQKYFSLYAQDAWRANSHLTLNYGLRYEPYLAVTSKYGWFTHFEHGLFDKGTRGTGVYTNAPAGLIFPGDAAYTPGNGIHNAQYNKFIPRFGFVWDPKGDGRMTVRGAYGMFTDRMNIYSLVTIGQNTPYGNVITLNNVNMADPWAAYPGGNPLPIPLTKDTRFLQASSITTHPLDLKSTYIHQWNLSIQRQLRQDWLLSLNYLGNSTIHLTSSDEQNPAVFLGTSPCTLQVVNAATGVVGPVNYPTCSTTANINQRRRLYLQNPSQGQYYAILASQDDGGTASYEGLYLAVQKRLSKGTTLLANYTWSHCIADVWNVFVGNNGISSVTPGNRRNDRSNCNTSDQRHVFNLSAVAQSPKFSGRALRMAASDWQLSGIVTARSSQFFTVTTGVDNAVNGEGLQRPNLVDNPYPANQTPTSWLSRAAFASPVTGTIGNLGNYNIKGPGNLKFDMGLSRTLSVHEKQTIQVRSEAFNILNHANYNPPIAALNSAVFGQIQSAGDPRIVQLALKYSF